MTHFAMTYHNDLCRKDLDTEASHNDPFRNDLSQRPLSQRPRHDSLGKQYPLQCIPGYTLLSLLHLRRNNCRDNSRDPMTYRHSGLDTVTSNQQPRTMAYSTSSIFYIITSTQ